MSSRTDSLLARNSAFAWVAIATALILLVPLIAMQITDEVNWGLSDFVAMGALLFFTGGAFVLSGRRFPVGKRLVIGIACACVFLYVWAELGVGIFTNIGN